MNALFQQLNYKTRDVLVENEQLKAEIAELRFRLESKEKNEFKLDNKIKALERVINNTRTPSAKENMKQLVTDTDVSFILLK